MKAYRFENGDTRLVGRADVPDDTGPVFEVPLFGAASVIAERFAIRAVTRLPASGGAPAAECAVLMAPDQWAELLPGWQPLAS